MGSKKDLAHLVWYLKWVASLILFTGLTIRILDVTGDYRYYDQGITLVGSAIWVWVGIIWKDNSVVLTNAPYVIMLTGSLIANAIYSMN